MGCGNDTLNHPGVLKQMAGENVSYQDIFMFMNIEIEVYRDEVICFETHKTTTFDSNPVKQIG